MSVRRKEGRNNCNIMYHLIDYVWTVENFSRYLDNHDQEVFPLLTSPIFSYKNTRWVLNLYPEGLGDSASQNYVSLFIKYVSEDPETINAKVELSLLNNKNEKVYCRDTGDHQYQTFIDFGYKQFLKIQDIKEQKNELLLKENLKIFARVEFENANLPSSITWANYDLLLLKENLKELYDTKNLSDIVIKVFKQPIQSLNSSNGKCLHCYHNNQHLYHPYKTAAKRLKPCICLTNNDYNDLLVSNNQNMCSLDSNDSFYGLNESSISSPSALSTSSYSSFSSFSSTADIYNNYQIYEIKAHKFVLASRSGKFRELLKNNIIKLNSYQQECKLKQQQQQQQQNNVNKRSNKITSNDTLSSSSSPSSSTSASSSSSSSSSSSAASSSSSSSSCSSGSSTSSPNSPPATTLSTCSHVFDRTSFIIKEHLHNNNYNNYYDDLSLINDLLIIETSHNPIVMEYLIRFIYTGYLDSLDSYAKEIYEVSKEYKVHGLTNLAREHIAKELNINNCCDYLIFCVVNNDNELNNKIQTFITENVETITKTNAYKMAKRKYRELFENTFNDIMKKVPIITKVHI